MIINIISLILSALAVFVSLYAVLEAQKNRKQTLRMQIIREHIKCLQEANRVINDIPITEKMSIVQFNQVVALKKVIDNNLWMLDESKYGEIKERFQHIYEKYEKAAGIKLNSFSADLESTCILYSEMEFPKELRAFYDETKLLIENELRKNENKLSEKL